MKIKQSNKQGGFTLVELAVVMVIIGILLSAILKGQDLIDNARAKTVLKDVKALEAMIWTFYDRQGRFPGDCDASGFMGITEVDPIADGVSDPLADLDGVDVTPVTKSCAPVLVTTGTKDTPVSDLRAELLLPFAPPNDEHLLHRYNGQIRPTQVGAAPDQRNAIMIYEVPQWIGEMIDASIDGEVDGTDGRVRFVDTAATAPYSDVWPTRTAAVSNVAVVYYFDKAP